MMSVKVITLSRSPDNGLKLSKESAKLDDKKLLHGGKTSKK